MTHGGEDPNEFQRLRAQVQIITETMRAFAEATPDPEALLNTVAYRAANALRAFCAVSILTDDGSWLRPVASFDGRGGEGAVIRRLISNYPLQADGPHPLAQALKSGECVTLPKLTEAQVRARYDRVEDQDAALRLGVQGLLFAPLRARGESIGGLSLIRYADGSSVFDADDVLFALHVADHAAIAITNGRLLAAAQQELAERRKAEAALRRTEEQLRHAQKMDAVGRLAGGIAHDFNNILSVILGCSEFISEEMSPTDPLREEIEQIKIAGQSAVMLTRQLLAFGRQQVLEPRVLDLNEVVRNMERLVPRLVGEAVEVSAIYGAELGRVRADEGHVEQVLVNLLVNARDAIEGGGKITIETANVDLDASYAEEHLGTSPGPHVMLAVSDTGAGMDRLTQERIFEPFFTTKPAGKGTGLGLSTVFGIVKQCGGSIWVYSEPGTGTTFKVYLPRTDQERALDAAAQDVLSPRGTETILLVEDNEQVRRVSSGILQRNGYQVLEAQNGAEGLTTCKHYAGEIQLLLTDVVMPEMSGRELSEHALRIRPTMKVLFMSGYTDDAILHHRVLTPGAALLQKPLKPGALLSRIRALLDGS